MLHNMVKQVEQTADFLKTKLQTIPQAAIVLGSGLDKLSEDIQTDVQLSYKDIPHFPVSTVQGHAGQLIMGQLGGVNVLAMKGRFHYYEGYNMQQITFPVRVFKQLGINVLILSNASGGMNPAYQIGDIVLLTDHINHFPESPLRGYNHDGWGDRFPDMSQTYSLRLRDAVKQIADKHRILIKEGVYVGTAGPAFETPAEYVMFWRMGADCVGMSTVPEAIVARHAGMECVAFSIITDLGIEGRVEKVSHADVLKAAQNAQPKLRCLVTELVKRLHAEVAS